MRRTLTCAVRPLVAAVTVSGAVQARFVTTQG